MYYLRVMHKSTADNQIPFAEYVGLLIAITTVLSGLSADTIGSESFLPFEAIKNPVPTCLTVSAALAQLAGSRIGADSSQRGEIQAHLKRSA
jgi:hypothetical protein